MNGCDRERINRQYKYTHTHARKAGSCTPREREREDWTFDSVHAFAWPDVRRISCACERGKERERVNENTHTGAYLLYNNFLLCIAAAAAAWSLNPSRWEHCDGGEWIKILEKESVHRTRRAERKMNGIVCFYSKFFFCRWLCGLLSLLVAIGGSRLSST